MNLDSNHSYGNRFVKFGDKGFNPALVSSFERYTDFGHDTIAVYFGSEQSSVLFKDAEAELVWAYLTANSTELAAPPRHIFCIYEDCDQTVPQHDMYCDGHLAELKQRERELQDIRLLSSVRESAF
jgi:hypothetical protein